MEYIVKLTSDLEIEINADTEVEAITKALEHKIPQEAIRWRASILKRPEQPVSEILTFDRPADMLEDEHEEDSM